MAKWLFEAGAAQDVRSKDAAGQTPLFCDCYAGHLDVAKWLFKVCSYRDSWPKDRDGKTPIRETCEEGHLDVVQWLILEGAANNQEGHVDLEIVQDEIVDALDGPSEGDLLECLGVLLDEHAAFMKLILPATARVDLESQTSPSSLSMLNGYQGSLMVLIADFVGVARGRRLRNLRETVTFIGADLLAARGQADR